MKKIFSSILLLILILSFSVAVDTTEHCWRQNKDRAVNVTVGFTGSNYGSTPDYNYVLSPGSSINISGIATYVIVCDNGATGSIKNYIALYDENTGSYLATNVPPVGAPIATTATGCFDSLGNACYTYGANGTSYTPAKGTCGRLEKSDTTQSYYTIGSGNQDIINYTFPQNEFGARTISIKLGTVSPETATSPNSPKMQYRTLNTITLFIGKPTLLTFSPEKRRILSTFEETGDQNIDLLFSLMNPSPVPIRLEDYNVNCPSEVTCYLETRSDGNKLYAGFTIPSGEAMIIPLKIKVNNNKAPLSFATGMNFIYNGVNQNCGSDGNPCTVSTELSRIDYALSDQQKFQVEVKTNIDQIGCIGEDGMIGQTGEGFAPRVNLSFGNETNPLISLNECDTVLENGEENNWVYCSQEEFLTELAAKIGKIGKLRQDILIAEYNPNASEETIIQLKDEEAKLSNFNSYLRTQIFNQNKISSSVEYTRNYITTHIASNSGLEIFGQDSATQADRFSKIINAITFTTTTNGVLQDSKNISAGLYKIRIDLNELSEILENNYLFSIEGTLNPALNIRVNLEQIQEPSFDWFFYHSPSNTLSDDYNLTHIPDISNAYTTNVSKRGIVLEYVEGTTPSFYRTYAAPLIVRLDANSAGKTNGQMKLDTPIIADQFNEENGVFSYWTGFASSIEDGCVSTITEGETTLPYRVPDLVKTNNGDIELNSFDYPMMDAKENSKMYLQTVLYMPKGKILNLLSPMRMYTKNSTCATAGNINCLVEIKEDVSTAKAYDLNAAFNGIREQKICVSKKVSANKDTWTLFWNQNEMLKLISGRKTEIINTINRDSNICETREILGG